MSETDRSNKIQNTWFQYQNFSFCVKLFKTQQICDQPFLHLNDNFFKKSTNQYDGPDPDRVHSNTEIPEDCVH